MIRVLCDENIAGVDDYLAEHSSVSLTKSAGRDIAHRLQTQAFDALFIRSVTPINPDELRGAHLPKFVGTATLGVDHVDVDWLKAQRIAFASAAGSSCHSVAQYVICAMYHLQPQLVSASALGNSSLTIGIIGLGSIGSALATYAADLNMRVLGYDPFLAPSAINNSTLDELLADSDVVTLHTPLTKDGAHATFGMANHEFFAKLKSSALFINAARGEIVCQEALMQDMAIHERQVVLDVFPYEPVIDKALLDALSLATPHIAGYTLDAKLRGTDMIYRAFCQCFDLPIRTHLQDVLPASPPTWQAAMAHIRQGKSLAPFYDIAQDDKNLRAHCTHKVLQSDFDRLRKEYRLKREWQKT